MPWHTINLPRIPLEELRQICHRPERLERLLRKEQEALALIEAARCLILCVDDDGERRELAADRAKQCVGKQEAAIAASSMVLVDGKAA